MLEIDKTESLARRLRYVKAKVDRPSASQQNLIVSILKHKGLAYGGPQDTYELRHIPVDEAIPQYGVGMIQSLTNGRRGKLLYSTGPYVATYHDNFDVVINGRKALNIGDCGRGTFGYRPTLAKIVGTFPSIGAFVGPRPGELDLCSGYPGFRFLGASDIPDVGWVIRERGPAMGEGYMVVSSGQYGVPATFDLDTVSFSNGFSCWATGQYLEVTNSFSDSVGSNLKVQFKWDAYTDTWVSTDVECA